MKIHQKESKSICNDWHWSETIRRINLADGKNRKKQRKIKITHSRTPFNFLHILLQATILSEAKLKMAVISDQGKVAIYQGRTVIYPLFLTKIAKIWNSVSSKALTWSLHPLSVMQLVSSKSVMSWAKKEKKFKSFPKLRIFKVVQNAPILQIASIVWILSTT